MELNMVKLIWSRFLPSFGKNFRVLFIYVDRLVPLKHIFFDFGSHLTVTSEAYFCSKLAGERVSWD